MKPGTKKPHSEKVKTTPVKQGAADKTDPPQSPIARAMAIARAYYGKGGPGQHMVQAKSLPEPRTARARLMVEAQAMAVFAIESYRPGPTPGQPLTYIVDMLVEGIASMQAAPDSLEYQVALARMYGGMRGGAAYVSKWEERIRGAWHDYDVDVRKFGAGTKPTNDSKFMHGLLGDALDVVGVRRPESFDWIKGLPNDNAAQLSVLGDFRVERCSWDATAETLKNDLHQEFIRWLEAAKKAHPERYGASEPLKMKAFAAEMNLSLATSESRLNKKESLERRQTWRGIRILPPSNEPAGDKAIRLEAEYREALRQAFVVPTKRK